MGCSEYPQPYRFKSQRLCGPVVCVGGGRAWSVSHFIRFGCHGETNETTEVRHVLGNGKGTALLSKFRLLVKAAAPY